MTDYWIKLYNEILDDPKMATLPDRLWRRTIELFLVCGRLSGTSKTGDLPETKQIAWLLRIPESELEADLIQIAELGIVVKTETGWHVRNFAKRQNASTSTERVRAFRQRQRNQSDQDSDKIAGIYKIQCLENGRVYIGSSIDVNRRINQHLYEGKTFSDHWMNEDIENFGADAFDFEILETIEELEQFPERETYWIRKHQDEGFNLYNKERAGKANAHRGGTVRSDGVPLKRAETDTESDKYIAEEEGEPPPNVFRAYEQEIGPLTPAIADALRDLEAEHPPNWIIAAMKIAAVNQKRSLAYFRAILDRWRTDGYGAELKRNGGRASPGRPAEPAGYAGIREWLSKSGEQLDDNST